jgi:hypothetical protein
MDIATFTNFAKFYIYGRPDRPAAFGSRRGHNDVLYCPTDAYVRWAEAYLNATGITAPNLIGYQYLPGRAYAATYLTVAPWCTRNKLAGPYRKAPIMADVIEEITGGNWVYSFAGTPLSSHIDRNNVSEGGNFLYEDGHVEWLKFKWGGADGTVDPSSEIQLGVAYSGYYEYLKPKAIGDGPW